MSEVWSAFLLRALAETLGLAGRATVLDGRDLPKPYALAELFVLPTHNENFGRVVAEALAAGVPVLTTTGTPWSEIEAADAGRWSPLECLSEDLDELLALSPRRVVRDGRAWPEVGAGALRLEHRRAAAGRLLRRAGFR
jgi:glycosyltransferase involved in cell wall biosynthesis